MHDTVPPAILNRRPRERSLLHWLHLVIGGVLSLPLFVLGLTGAILVFEHQIDDWLEPLPRAAALGPVRPADDILAAARAAAPPGAAPVLLVPAATAGEAAEVRFRSPAAGFVRVFVDPASLAVLAVRRPGGSVMRTLAALHSNLLVRDRIGRQVVGWLGVAMLALGVSGLVLWWPRRGRWRAAFRIERRARGAALLRELHRTAGFWALAVFLIVSFSGVYLAFPETIGDAVRSVAPGRDVRAFAGPPVRPIAGATPLDLADAISLARRAAPGAELRSVGLPLRPDQAIRVSLALPGTPAGPVPTIVAFVDPWSRHVVELRDPRTYTPGETLLAWQRALHAGEGFGSVWQGLVFVVGLLPPFFAVSGVAMWALKRRARRKAAVASRARR